ncbi:MAG: polysaccharide deacetylase family protein [Oscillospiraceae bacterium]|nr:polysaccharide deacetylase family protein [Oscillospiraceae bacterium]
MRGRIFLIRRKYVTALALVLAVAAIFYIVNHPRLTGDSGGRALPIYSVQREDRAMSLTFNAAEPEDFHTAKVLETLNAHGVRATFFVTAEWARHNETLAARIVTGGHELMNLGDDHRPLRQINITELQARVLACNDAIWAVTGAAPTVFRALYGQYDDRMVTSVRALGMHTVQWSIDSGDRRGADASTITRQVLGRAAPGSIVLFHSNAEQTVCALPDILAGLHTAGYEPVPVSELMLQTEYTISLTGRQMPG